MDAPALSTGVPRSPSTSDASTAQQKHLEPPQTQAPQESPSENLPPPLPEKQQALVRRSSSRLVRPERAEMTRHRFLVADSRSRPVENFSRNNFHPAEHPDRNHQHFHRQSNGYGDWQHQELEEGEPRGDWWTAVSRWATCCICTSCITSCGKMYDPEVQQAWREKVTLVMIILLLCVLLGFLTFGVQLVLCTGQDSRRRSVFSPPRTDPPDYWAIHGQWYFYDQNYMRVKHPNSYEGLTSTQVRSRDISQLFVNSFRTQAPACQALLGAAPPEAKICRLSEATNLPEFCHVIPPNDLAAQLQGLLVTYEWEDLTPERGYFVVFNGIVLDMQNYMDNFAAGDEQGYLGPEVKNLLSKSRGQDITLQTYHSEPVKARIQCMIEMYQTGFLSKESPGCFASNVLNYLSLAVILSLIFIRFAMAIMYSWFIAPRITKTPSGPTYLPPGMEPLKRKSRYDPPGSTSSRFRSTRASSWTDISDASGSSYTSYNGSRESLRSHETAQYGDPLKPYVILMVTCYSEDEAGMRATLESLAQTDYNDSNQLFVIAADGLVENGEVAQDGTKLTTADVCIKLLRLDPQQENRDPEAKSYVAIAEGSRQHNKAKVYAGFFDSKEHSIPAILIVKCGIEDEQKERKPGNRGKRDSQIILMNFLSKVMFDDRMSPLEYDLFQKIRKVAGVTPDFYEMLLMVDADTVVEPGSLAILVNTMRNDVSIMGVCGETQIANKTQNWVTAIQVYEYYISHHMAKAFESMFGGVTCLPGCFSMYRIKAPKGEDGFWVPILANPDIVEEYSQNVVDTLHKKNLLSLGEDRFLSTLMLRTFPKRHMMFVPQAKCQTVVPHKFSILVSQRRRWINSTVHNLMELALVKDLCGTFCFSMQCVVFIDLLGTLVLPAAIIFTAILIYAIATPATSFMQDSIIPLIMLLSVLVLPALIVLVNAHNPMYFFWLLVYLVALPIWNFALPVYAFWHFDDFTWGKTREVSGNRDKATHGKSEGEFDVRGLVMKRWEEWERERLQLAPLSTNLTADEIQERVQQRPPAGAFPISALATSANHSSYFGGSFRSFHSSPRSAPAESPRMLRSARRSVDDMENAFTESEYAGYSAFSRPPAFQPIQISPMAQSIMDDSIDRLSHDSLNNVQHSGQTHYRRSQPRRESVPRSNSSLELDHQGETKDSQRY